METDMKTELKAEDYKSKLLVVAWAELELLRDSLEQVMDGCMDVLTIQELQKLENVAHGLEHLMSREELEKLRCSQTATEPKTAEDR
jgi:hypothetical protein